MHGDVRHTGRTAPAMAIPHASAARQVAAQQVAQQAAADAEQRAKVAELDANKRLLEVDQARHDETQAKRQRLIAEGRLRAEQKGHTEERQRRLRAEAAHLELEKLKAQRETLRAAAPALWSGAANAQSDPSPPANLTSYRMGDSHVQVNMFRKQADHFLYSKQNDDSLSVPETLAETHTIDEERWL